MTLSLTITLRDLAIALARLSADAKAAGQKRPEAANLSEGRS